jgi:hypothetical protein
MYISDDATMDEVVEKTVAALKEAARHVGKADSTIAWSQAKQIKEAIDGLTSAPQFKGAANG